MKDKTLGSLRPPPVIFPGPALSELTTAEREAGARNAVRRVRWDATRSLTKDGSRQYWRNYVGSLDVPDLVDLARDGDKDALDRLRDYARGVRRAIPEIPSLDIPRELLGFTLEFFIDGQPKARPGPSPRDTTLRNRLVVSLVKIVNEEFGFDVHRNEDLRNSNEGTLSACAIVADELGLGESNVEDIWNDLKSTLGR
jgi:hypothetical protein